jgi:hypothetical protein
MLQNLDCRHSMEARGCSSTATSSVGCDFFVFFLLEDHNFNLPLLWGITIVVNLPKGTSFSTHRVSAYLVVEKRFMITYEVALQQTYLTSAKLS